MKDMNEAIAFIRPRPSNVKYCVSMQRDPRAGIRVTPNRTDPMDSWRGPVRIITDMRAQLE